MDMGRVEAVLPWVTLPDLPKLTYEEKKERVRHRFDIFGGVVRILFEAEGIVSDAKACLQFSLYSMNDYNCRLKWT